MSALGEGNVHTAHGRAYRAVQAGALFALAAGLGALAVLLWQMVDGEDDGVPADWLTEADQEQLADFVATVSGRQVWAVGCVFPPGTKHEALELADLAGYRRDDAWAVSVVSRARGGGLLVVLSRPRSTPAAGEFDEVVGPDYFFYRPQMVADGPTA